MAFRNKSVALAAFICLVLMAAPEVLAQTAEQAPAAPSDAPGFWSLLFDKGGLVTWAIALLSAIGLPVAMVKIYHFYRMDIWRPARLEAAMAQYRAGTGKGLIRQLANDPHPAAGLLAFAMNETAKADLSADLLREEMTRRAQYLLRHLASNIWILELIAASAPLFGLLGTVLGMIVAFQGVGAGASGADTAVLAAGIWEALLTTAFGLGVALPFSMLAAVFNNAVDNLRGFIEDALTEIMVRSQSGEAGNGGARGRTEGQDAA